MYAACHRLLHLLVIFALLPAATSTAALTQGGGGGQEERRGESAEGTYEVTVDCTYAENTDQTTCAFQGVAGPGAKDVSHVDVPEAAVCAEIVGGDYEYVSPDPNTGVTGFKSKGSRGTLTLVLVGEVRVDGTATYAIKSGDGVFRTDGPGLVCDAADKVGDVDTERMTVRLVTFHCPAEGKSETVFEALETDGDEG